MDAFLKRRLDFISIPKVVEKVLDKHKNILAPDLDGILEADTWGRQEAYKVIERLN